VRPGKKPVDPRLKPRRFSWKEFGVIFGVLVLLATAQLMIRSAFPDSVSASRGFSIVLFVYWAIVSYIFCRVLARQRQRVFDEPMRQLSDTADRVAGGDFTVRLPLSHPQGRWDYVDVMFNDFNTMVAQLGSIETLKDGFIADVSHELKTPLAIIGNYAHALEDSERLTAEQRHDYSQVIVKATGALAALVTNILKLNKLENEQIAPVTHDFDLARQLAEVALALADSFDAKGVDLVVELEDEATISSDEGMLEIVWQNLLGNALKFTPPGGTVSLQQTSSPAQVVVSVRDTGYGMDDATRSHIFDKFYRGAGQASADGDGLGLALVRRVAGLVGATVSVESAPGHGSTFTLTIPRSPVKP
jgi:signal transduction histidine kinase